MVDDALRYRGGTVPLRESEGNGAVELGFPPEFVERAFERFSRADAARGDGGTGLGLAIVDAIARAHGGSAHAANVDGSGAEVWVSLPKRLNAVDAPGRDRSDVG